MGDVPQLGLLLCPCGAERGKTELSLSLSLWRARSSVTSSRSHSSRVSVTGSRPIPARCQSTRGEQTERSAHPVIHLCSLTSSPADRATLRLLSPSARAHTLTAAVWLKTGRRAAGCAMGQACGHALLCRSQPPSSEM